jgi:glycosyltransferase involved in cell wall biosynthesis
MAPVATIGLPMHNGQEFVAEAIESLLDQTLGDFRLVLFDDCSSDETASIAAGYVDDPRVTLQQSKRRLGLVGAWQVSHALAVDLAPDATYFAWASDHDVWHRQWLEVLADELDAHPEAVLAAPLDLSISELGADLGKEPWRFSTAGVNAPRDRLLAAVRGMRPGVLVYGLFRTTALAKVGTLPLVPLPDKLLLARLALEGEFRQVDRILWQRRFRTAVRPTRQRQRQAFFTDSVPVWSYLPSDLIHAVLLVGSPPRTKESVRLAATYLGASWVHALGKRRAKLTRAFGRQRRRARGRARRAIRSLRRP